MSDFSRLLSAYGFNEKEQQLDVIRLLYLAGCFDLDKLQEDLIALECTPLQIEMSLKVVTAACSGEFQNKDLQRLNAEDILHKLFSSAYELSETKQWPEKLHNWLIRATQREFFARSAGQERWQQATGQWMTQYENDIRAISNELDLEKEVLPQKQDYKGIAIFGSTAPEMKQRLDYVKQLIDQGGIRAQQVYLLCGERPADIKMDVDTEEYVNLAANRFSITKEQVTETHLMQVVYDEVKAQSTILKELPYHVIDTPKGNKPRPTTLDTLLEFAKRNPFLKGDILFVSRAPNIQAQREDVSLVIREQLLDVSPETVGARCENVAIKRVMGALGGALYGGYVRVAQQLGCPLTRVALEEKRNKFSFNAQQAQMKESQERLINKVIY